MHHRRHDVAGWLAEDLDDVLAKVGLSDVHAEALEVLVHTELLAKHAFGLYDALHVVLVDNGRTNLLADDVAWEALRCVRCGACLNICPVYRQTGGHAYGYTYSGPIGAIIAPGLLGLEEAMPLPFASSLCGACADVCPVRIPIPELLVHWRERAVEEGLTSKVEGMGLEAFTAAAAHPTLYKAAAALLRHTPWQAGGSALPILKGWMQERTAPEPSPKSFQTLWKEGIE